MDLPSIDFATEEEEENETDVDHRLTTGSEILKEISKVLDKQINKEVASE